MTIFFLVATALAWLAVMLPAARRARRSTPYLSAETFKRRMNLVAPARARIARYVPEPAPRPTSSGRYVVVPKVRDPESERHERDRRRVLAEHRRREREAARRAAAARQVGARREGAAPAGRPGARDAARRHRRRQAFCTLLGWAGISLLIALVAGGGWWEVHLLADLVVALYAIALAENRRRRAETLRKVRSIEGRRAPQAAFQWVEERRA